MIIGLLTKRLRRMSKKNRPSTLASGIEVYPSFWEGRELFMNAGLKKLMGSKLRAGVGLVLGVAMLAGVSAFASTFEIPEDTALRIRLDDTLTSLDSQVDDPFSASVVDTGEYRNARVYGHIAEV